VAPVGHGVAGRALSLAAAQVAGLVSVSDTPAGTLVVSDAARPVRITATGSQAVVVLIELHGGRPATTTVYGPLSGTLAVTAAGRATLTRDGRVIAPRRLRHPRPVTHATVTVTGSRVTVHFHVADPVGVAYTVAFLGGRRLNVRDGQVALTRTEAARLRFYSVDLLGNRERPHGLTARQLRAIRAARTA
jgi:hypothetical protein